MQTKLLSVPVSLEVRERFKTQIMERGARERRFLTIAQAVREALVAYGFDLSEPKQATEQDRPLPT